MTEVKIAVVPPPPCQGDCCMEKDREIQRLKEKIEKLEKIILKTKYVVKRNKYVNDTALMYYNVIKALYEE